MDILSEFSSQSMKWPGVRDTARIISASHSQISACRHRWCLLTPVIWYLTVETRTLNTWMVWRTTVLQCFEKMCRLDVLSAVAKVCLQLLFFLHTLIVWFYASYFTLRGEGEYNVGTGQQAEYKVNGQVISWYKGTSYVLFNTALQSSQNISSPCRSVQSLPKHDSQPHSIESETPSTPSLVIDNARKSDNLIMRYRLANRIREDNS